MKIYSFIIVAIFLSSCALKVNQDEAKQVAESLLEDLKQARYDDLNNYYSDLSNESQPLEQKILRFKQLEEVTGPIKSFEFMNANQEYDSDKGLNQLTLKYKVFCENVTVIQTFLFINDEGNSRIIFQNIENFK
jgi:Skp family chaperone for outer membrane proteins